MGGSSSKMEGAQRSKSAPAAPGQYPNGYTPGPWPGYPEGPVIPAAPKRKNSATKAFKSVLKRPRGFPIKLQAGGRMSSMPSPSPSAIPPPPPPLVAQGHSPQPQFIQPIVPPPSVSPAPPPQDRPPPNFVPMPSPHPEPAPIDILPPNFVPDGMSAMPPPGSAVIPPRIPPVFTPGGPQINGFTSASTSPEPEHGLPRRTQTPYPGPNERVYSEPTASESSSEDSERPNYRSIPPRSPYGVAPPPSIYPQPGQGQPQPQYQAQYQTQPQFQPPPPVMPQGMPVPQATPAPPPPQLSGYRTPMPGQQQPMPRYQPAPQPNYQPAPQPNYQPAPQPNYQPAPTPAPAPTQSRHRSRRHRERDYEADPDEIIAHPYSPQPEGAPVFGPGGSFGTGRADNPLPPPPRDLYEFSPWKRLVGLPTTEFLMRDGWQRPDVDAQLPPDPEPKRGGLFRAFGKKDKRSKHASEVRYVPVFPDRIAEEAGALGTGGHGHTRARSEPPDLENLNRGWSHNFVQPAPGAAPPGPQPGRAVVYFTQTSPFPGFMQHSPHRVLHNGHEYPTAHHLFAALMFEGREDIQRLIRGVAVQETGAVGARYEGQSDPNFDPLRAVDQVLRLKFAQHADLALQLLGTEDAELIYSDMSDTWWGIGPDGSGSNEFGKALMRVRGVLAARERAP